MILHYIVNHTIHYNQLKLKFINIDIIITRLLSKVIIITQHYYAILYPHVTNLKFSISENLTMSILMDAHQSKEGQFW